MKAKTLNWSTARTSSRADTPQIEPGGWRPPGLFVTPANWRGNQTRKKTAAKPRRAKLNPGLGQLKQDQCLLCFFFFRPRPSCPPLVGRVPDGLALASLAERIGYPEDLLTPIRIDHPFDRRADVRFRRQDGALEGQGLLYWSLFVSRVCCLNFAVLRPRRRRPGTSRGRLGPWRAPIP